MPVKYLVNVPKNNLVLSLHVFWYTFGIHGGHVSLQSNDKRATDVCSEAEKPTPWIDQRCFTARKGPLFQSQPTRCLLIHQFLLCF